MKKYYNLIIIILVMIIIAVLSWFIYINLFKSNDSDRLENIENYKLTKNEKNKIKEKINELENIDSIDIYTNYKTLTIFIELKEDENFSAVKRVCNESIEMISEKNLGFYDVEVFVDSLNEESEVYPKIGYKHKSDSKFSWNR